jgi:hypothetical protein
METFHEYIHEYRKQLEKGTIQKAYKGLMEYITALRMHFKNTYPDFVSGGIYHGYMDMTYFPIFPQSFKQRQLKIAIVFLHEPFRFEVWLAGNNKQVQKTYWTLFKESDWNTYPVVPTTKGVDAILESIVVDNPDFRDSDRLTTRIDRATLKFIRDVETFLLKHEN